MNNENIKKGCVAVIPARGGSKAIPGKNIMDFCGRPLITWSIWQALRSSYVGEVYVTTDDRKIADISSAAGARVIARPAELATDTATSEDALLHAVSEIEKTRRVDTVVFLQATSPLREPGDIDAAVKKFVSGSADSLFSASVLDDLCVWSHGQEGLRSLTYDYLNRGRRQERPPLYLENGSIYIFKPGMLRKHKNRLGGRVVISLMDYWKSYEIDKPEDVSICEYFMKKNLIS